MSVLFLCHEENRATWLREIRAAAPELELCSPDEIDDPAAVEFAIVARTRPGELRRYPALRAILSMWAGVEHLLADPDIPPNVQIVRMVEPSLTRGMVEYICCHVLNILLRTDCYPSTGWSHPQKSEPRFAADFPVGIMGIGVLGSACALTLRQLGFPVSGWSRTPRTIDGVRMFAGHGDLETFLRESRVLVLLLPNTPETQDILDSRTIGYMSPGASVINAGRGELIDEQSLLDALDHGRLERAVLDVFTTEPLPDDHAFRLHPKITVTPHIASVTNPRTAAPVLAASIRRLRNGEEVWPLVDRDRGY